MTNLRRRSGRRIHRRQLARHHRPQAARARPLVSGHARRADRPRQPDACCSSSWTPRSTRADRTIGVGVLLFDVDRFKLINDSLGHDRGDQLLVAIADVLREHARAATRRAARFDSDSFAVVIRRCSLAPDQALELAGRIRGRLGRRTDGRRATGTTRPSASGSSSPSPATPRSPRCATPRPRCTAPRNRAAIGPSGSIRRCTANVVDRASRSSATSGRRSSATSCTSCSSRCSTSRSGAGQRAARRSSVGTTPNAATSSPTTSSRSPKSTGLIVSLGRWVLRHALAAAADWPEAVQVAVNLSAPELAEPDLVAFVHGTLAELDVAGVATRPRDHRDRSHPRSRPRRRARSAPPRARRQRRHRRLRHRLHVALVPARLPDRRPEDRPELRHRPRPRLDRDRRRDDPHVGRARLERDRRRDRDRSTARAAAGARLPVHPGLPDEPTGRARRPAVLGVLGELGLEVEAPGDGLVLHVAPLSRGTIHITSNSLPSGSLP